MALGPHEGQCNSKDMLFSFSFFKRGGLLVDSVNACPAWCSDQELNKVELYG